VKLFIDTETFSATPIKAGTYRYIADSELMIVTWAFDDGPINLWDVTSGAPMPADLANTIVECDEVWAHNAMFDRNVLAKHLPEVPIPLPKWRCMMVRALAHSLPGGLDRLCEITEVGQDEAKHKAGEALVQLFCKPRPKNTKLRRATRETHPVEWQRFCEYAKADISAMRALDKKIPMWNYKGAELALWHLDQRINDRGFQVDTDLASSAIRAVEVEQVRLADEVNEHTDGYVERATQRDLLLAHILGSYGVVLPDLKSSTLERRLDDPELPEGVKELIRIRLQASTSSTSKYTRIINGSTEGRMRGTLQFAGAGRTARWAGRTFQPQNLPRYALEWIADYHRCEAKDLNEVSIATYLQQGIEALKAGVADLLFENVMALCANTIRSVIIAPPGRKLVVADLANIEGRVLAWLAGEHWKLQAFREYDEGNGPDLYKLAYSKSFGIKPEGVSKSQRQIGKVMELMLGYEGGVGAFITGAATYGFDVEELGVTAEDTIPGDVLYDATGFYDWTLKQKRPTFGLSQRAFVVCDSIKRVWRRAHPKTQTLWKDLEAACVDAVTTPGTTFVCRGLKVRRDGAWLRIGLPSGRALCYPQPQVKEGKLSYMGLNQYTHQWSRIKTYGGKLTENVTQAVARDILAASMPDIDATGYDVVLTVHDEIITECLDTDDYNVETLCQMMCDAPPWAEGLPLAAAGFEAYRYRKE
jgi:DNA polymerase